MKQRKSPRKKTRGALRCFVVFIHNYFFSFYLLTFIILFAKLHLHILKNIKNTHIVISNKALKYNSDIKTAAVMFI